jgi:tetratricopeptide (TPR) repeat protein
MDELQSLDALFAAEELDKVIASLKPRFEGGKVADAPRHAWRFARALRASYALDRALLVLKPALVRLDALPREEAEEAFALEAELYGAKRCRKLALRELARAREQLGDAPRFLLAEARVELAVDDRARASELARKASSAGVAGAEATVARLAYIQGEFAGALASIERVPRSDPSFLEAARLCASIRAAQNDFAGEAQSWRTVLEHAKTSDFRPTDWLNLGFALAAAGRRDEAREELSALWRAYPSEGPARYARSRAEALERAPATAGRKTLAFPTTAQKRNYCGPAVLEICLRYLGIELGQDEIAGHVKRETGTPMFEIVRFLEERDIEVRRVVVTPERVRTAIDCGLPIILQEEYSTTSHVAVITGYDDALQVLVMHDPMTHRALTRPMDWSQSAGQLYGSGGVLVVGRKGPELDALRAKLDEAGLVDAEHLRAIDDCSRRRPSTQGGAFEPAHPEEELAATDRALAIDPSFRLAWMYRWYAKRALYLKTRSNGWRDDTLDDLYWLRTRFPADEWPCQLHGRWLLDHDRHAEAFAAFLDAHLRDEGDGNNLVRMAECKRYLGMLADSETYLLRGLERFAADGSAEWVLSAIYLRAAEALDEAAAKKEPRDEPSVSIEIPQNVKQSIVLERDVLLERATHFNEISRELEPNNPYHQEVAGLVALRRGDAREAEDFFRRALEIDPKRWFGSLGLAAALELREKRDEALPHLRSLTERWPGDPDAWSALCGFLGRGKDVEAHVAALTQAIERSGKKKDRFVVPLFKAMAKQSSSEEAAARVRELAEKFPSDTDLLWAAANHLDEQSQRGHAIGLLRKVVDIQPKNASALGRLGRLLRQSLATRAEGIQMLERAMQLSPSWSFVRRPLALHHLQSDPEKGLSVMAPVLGEDSPWNWEVQAMLLDALGRKEEAERAMRRAIAAYDGTPARAIEALCDWHRHDDRYDRALYWASRLFEQPVAPDRVEWAQLSLVSTYRLAGKVEEIMPRIREICAGEVPVRLAWELYFALKDVDHALAEKVAHAKAEASKDDEEKLRWRIREACQRAHKGDDSLLARVHEAAGEKSKAWSQIAVAYEDLERYEAANEAADRAYALDPKDAQAISTMMDAEIRRGNTDQALALARRLHELFPYDHRGPERIAEITAKRGEQEDALAYSAQAVDAAPYCSTAQEVRALALALGGDLTAARPHAERSLSLTKPARADAPRDALMILRALDGDTDGLERCFARLDVVQPLEAFPKYRAFLLGLAEKHRARA